MAEEDSEWIIESIVGFLGSPEWLIPVMDFVENKCTVFDDEDENKLSYTDVHQQYKTLVEKLLENYMQEVGISEQQFLDACTSPFAKSKSLQSVFQPVLATDDFQMFRSLMAQKNMELQLQALRLIKERNGELPECLTDGVDVMTEMQQQEMKILQEVLQKSKEEYEEEMSRRLMSGEDVGSTSSVCSTHPTEGRAESNKSPDHTAKPPLSLQVNDSADTVEERVRSEPGSGREEVSSKSQESPKLSPVVSSSSMESRVLPAVTAPLKSSQPISSSISQAAAETCLEEARREAGFSKPFTELSVSQQEQLQQRAAYLRQQRDKLHALKKEQQRTKQNSSAGEAPPTLTAAPTKSPVNTVQEISAEERKKLQKRKHLADKLKEEVIRK
ncbi:cilia- and flagella-associated protein 36 isoform X2 [Cynoglossus semilaevis]|uniref:Cilia- and flagella-associated protein 36 n=1 Tax=Cynoglossus semilaevis TaxID=244447 RepID=A0A3P8UHB2_CYNSE|nr:cilia- and flagella-associated protein 36 isoform X2 [Cynoglossus semilaevis]